MKATVFRSVLLSAVGQYPAPRCRTTLPAAFSPGSDLSYAGASVGCSEGASDAEVLLCCPWQLQPQQKAAIYWPGYFTWLLGEHQDGLGADGCWGDPMVLLGQHPIRHPARRRRSCPHTSSRSRSPGAGVSNPEHHIPSGPRPSLGRRGLLGLPALHLPHPHSDSPSQHPPRPPHSLRAGWQRGVYAAHPPWSQWSI